MAEVFFPEYVNNFIASLGDTRIDVLADLMLIGEFRPEALSFCSDLGGGIWEYSRYMGFGSDAYLLFTYTVSTNSYVVLHAFRGASGGSPKAELRFARKQKAKL
ncbi:MAG TPA: hypothetical protein VGB65_06785 [Allosphingosinicella sp.]|jgi:hypothetical protein